MGSITELAICKLKQLSSQCGACSTKNKQQICELTKASILFIYLAFVVGTTDIK